MANNSLTRSWVEVRPESLSKNALTIRTRVGDDCRIVPMVKADAYGLGVENILPSLETCNPWGFGVATVEEGCHLREIGVKKPVVIFSPIPYDSYKVALEKNLTVTVSSLEALGELLRVSKKLKTVGRFHLEVDTGMGRAGFDWKTVDVWGEHLKEFSKQECLLWEGTYTHFHSSDSDSSNCTEVQYERFSNLAIRFPHADEFFHTCNSAAIFLDPAFKADGVRPGIFLYGGHVGLGGQVPEEVVSLRARVVLVRNVEKNTTLGYGATYESVNQEKWAILGIGYGDGFPRKLGNRGQVLLRGTRVPIIGRVSMDTIVVNVTGVSGVEIGDIATLIGRDGQDSIALDEVATAAETVSYEILTGLTSRLPRVLV